MATKTSAIIKAIKDLYDLSYPLFYDHAPSGTNYPLITYNVISANKNTVMAGDGGNPLEYVDCRVQFTAYVNEQQQETGWGIVEDLENLFNYATLDPTSKHLVCMKSLGDAYAVFYNDEKMWGFTQDYSVKVGD